MEDRFEIVDPHQHFWNIDQDKYPWLSPKDGIKEHIAGDPAPLKRNYLIHDYLAESKKYFISKTVHVQAEYDHADPVGETRFLFDISNNNDRKIPNGIVAYANLADPNVDQVLRSHSEFPSVRGIRMLLNLHPNPKYCFADREYITSDDWQNGYSLLKKYNLSFDMHIYKNQMKGKVTFHSIGLTLI